MIDAKKTAILMIDMQKGFIEKSSALCVAGAEATIPACAKALAQARSMGIKVIHVWRNYAQDGSDIEAIRYQQWKEGGKPVSSARPESMEPPSELAPHPNDKIMYKPRFSAFFATALDEILRSLSIETVIVTGTTTPNCIRQTCYDALSLNYNVVVIQDCTSSRTQQVQDANIEDLRHIGVQIIDSDSFLEEGLSAIQDIAGNYREGITSR